ncbi:7109_t:CDS:2, partial [Acaulospora colombiana]
SQQCYSALSVPCGKSFGNEQIWLDGYTNAVRVDFALLAGGVSNRDEFRSLLLSSSELTRFLLVNLVTLLTLASLTAPLPYLQEPTHQGNRT